MSSQPDNKINFTTYIVEDLKTQIRAGTISNFSQRHLAAIYETSTRPVGQALNELITDAYLRRMPNGRIAIEEKLPTLKDIKKINAPSQPDDLRKRIEIALIHDCLSGQEHFIREEKMAGQFHIGRTALRNIFSELALTGLIIHRPRKGWQLRSFNEKDLQDYLSIREHLECMALDAAKDHLDDTILSELLRLNQDPQPSPKTHSTLGSNSLHSYIIKQANNNYLSLFFEHYAPFFELLFNWEAQDLSMLRETRAQHRNILQHLIDHEWEQAKSALRNHIRNNHTFLSKMLNPLKENIPEQH